MNNRNFIWRFTPSRTDPELLEAIFVQRESLLIDVLERIKDSAQSGNKHHMLLVGPRGIGKTHFVALVYSRVRKDPELEDAVRIAWLNEDETTTSFVQLLVKIYRALAHDYASEFSADWLDKLLGSPPDEVELRLEHLFVQSFQDKTLLILVENLDALFDGLGDIGQKKWRSFMQEHPFTSILATSQQLFRGVQNQDKVFYGFFTPIHLKPLALEDAIQLLSNVAKAKGQPDLVAYLATPEGRSRVRAIRHLAGGNHRIFIVLSSFITRDTLDDLVEPFEKMADELTPYYQERLRWLSAQQRQVIELLCSHPSPLSPSEVAKQLLAPENSIGTQFKRLTQLKYVKRSQRGRESLYELTEPLMRLASEVKERKPLRLLVSFLRVWYHPEYLFQILRTTQNESLKLYTSLALKENQVVKVWNDKGIDFDERKRYEEALACYAEALDLDPRSAPVWYNKGISFYELEQYEEALACYDKVLDLEPNHAKVWNNRGNTLSQLKRYEEALACYDKALDLEPDHATARINKGITLYNWVKAQFSLKLWTEGFEALEEALSLNQTEFFGDTASMITLITLIHRSTTEEWKGRLANIVEIYAKAGRLEPLGEGLVQSLAWIEEEMLSEKALYLYRDTWLELGRGHVELEVPLRIFGVGIEYLAKKRDPKVLLDLLESERLILEQLFGLVEEGEE